eukprot:gene2385-biopygen11435
MSRGGCSRPKSSWKLHSGREHPRDMSSSETGHRYGGIDVRGINVARGEGNSIERGSDDCSDSECLF